MTKKPINLRDYYQDWEWRGECVAKNRSSKRLPWTYSIGGAQGMRQPMTADRIAAFKAAKIEVAR